MQPTLAGLSPASSIAEFPEHPALTCFDRRTRNGSRVTVHTSPLELGRVGTHSRFKSAAASDTSESMDPEAMLSSEWVAGHGADRIRVRVMSLDTGLGNRLLSLFSLGLLGEPETRIELVFNDDIVDRCEIWDIPQTLWRGRLRATVPRDTDQVSLEADVALKPPSHWELPTCEIRVNGQPVATEKVR